MSTQHTQRTRGADFSSAQSIDEVRQVARVCDFAFVKATQGADYVNPLAAEQVRVLEHVGVFTGLYHFLDPNLDGASQWDYFQAHLPGILGPAANGAPSRVVNVPLALDYEAAGTSDALARAFIRRGRQRGFRVGVYGSAAICRRRFRLRAQWSWVAWWAPSPPPGLRWDFWQWTDGGGRQDYNVFRGDRAQLEAWWRKQAGHTPKHESAWWLTDLERHTAIGPLHGLISVGPRFAVYAARHPRTFRYSLERK